MVSLQEVVAYLEAELKTAEITDYSGALNGLQLANHGEVTRIVSAVDASLPVVETAAAGGPGLLIVHHGMFWQGVQPVTGAFYRKLKTAMDAGLAIYSSHLPLDVHAVFGNNIQLANALGIGNPEPFFEHKGALLGVRGGWFGSREALRELLAQVLHGPVHMCPGGPEMISSVGIITGGAGSEAAKVFAAGVDTFITGEGPHWSYPLAEEFGMNLFYGGHYATETFGVRAISQALAERYLLPHEFIHHPTGL